MKRNKIIIISAAVIVALCAAVSAFAVQLAVIDGDSMKPTYHHFEFALINKTAKKFSTGDVAAVKLENGRTIVKRIAAVPSETVQISDGKLLINGEESLLYKSISFEYAGTAENKITLSEDEYFVLGDNVSESRDSRYEDVGVIKSDSIIGLLIPQKPIEQN